MSMGWSVLWMKSSLWFPFGVFVGDGVWLTRGVLDKGDKTLSGLRLTELWVWVTGGVNRAQESWLLLGGVD